MNSRPNVRLINIRAASMQRPFTQLALLSVIGFLASILLHDVIQIPGICGSLSFAALNSMGHLVVALSSPEDIILSWTAMLFAMMPLLVLRQVSHIHMSSPKGRYLRALACFLFAYLAVWLAVGLFLIQMGVLIRIFVSPISVLPTVLLIALIWTASPWSQRAKNKCHLVQRIGIFGFAADIDSFRFGIASGWHCVGVCWPWMLIMLVLDQHHTPAMFFLTLALLWDRQTSLPRQPIWRMPQFPSHKALTASIRRFLAIHSSTVRLWSNH